MDRAPKPHVEAAESPPAAAKTSRARDHRWRPRVSILLKLILLAVVMVPVATLPVLAGLAGVDDMRGHANQIDFHEDALAAAGAVSAAVSDARAVALRVLIAGASPKQAAALKQHFRTVSIPRVNASIATLGTRSLASGAVGRATLAQLGASWQQVLENLPDIGRLKPRGAIDRAAAIESLFAPTLRQAAHISATSAEATDRSHQAALQSAAGSRRYVLIASGIMDLTGCGLVALLAITIVPRLRRYARFAEAVSSQHADSELVVTGTDEIATLGIALNEMVQAHSAQERHDSSQAEFANAMQLAETETEAQELLERQIERSVPASRVLTLSRNNSENRLEPSHADDLLPALMAGLQDARPTSCMAVRSAHAHSTAPGGAELISCRICAQAGEHATCEPLIVSGAVLGSVLTLHPRKLSERQRRAISESVSLAAPAIGNLRNLALAERRAGTDVLTGLPNRRSLQDTLNMMAAHCIRAETSLAVLALDLDHFKMVNDTHGHEAGDRLLAAVGSALRTSVRESDFVGRAGGEEFTILLPDTTLAGAHVVAEKVRERIERVEVPSIHQRVTASIGIAALPEQAENATELLRLADRALYTAKSTGRNRCEVFTDDRPDRPADSHAATHAATHAA